MLEAVLRAAIAENAVERHLPLLRGVPFLARTGDADQTVSAYWARRATRILSDAAGAAAGAAGGVAVAGAGGVAGRAVAIKVQYPGVADSIQSDLWSMKQLITYTGIVPKGLFLDRVLEVAHKELMQARRRARGL